MCRLCVEVHLMTQDEYDSGNEPSNDEKRRRLNAIIDGDPDAPITVHQLIEISLVQLKREGHTVINIRNLAREVDYALTDEDLAAIEAEDDGDPIGEALAAMFGMGGGGGGLAAMLAGRGGPPGFGAVLDNGNIEVDDGRHPGEIPIEMAEMITGRSLQDTLPDGMRPTAQFVDVPEGVDEQDHFASLVLDGLIHQLYGNNIPHITFARIFRERVLALQPELSDKIDDQFELSLIGALRLLSEAADLVPDG